ncbi:MAG: SDR family oxidoreductase [Desulfuromonadales bacterium]|nr:SDR family oxidoreductase [Desulfuromonadales bacterium]
MKHLVLTGANRGIGLELARHYQAGGWQVTAVCRESSPELAALTVKVIAGIDVTDEHCLAGLAVGLEGQPIDLLINNAGILCSETLGTITPGSLRLQMEVNAFAPLLICQALLPNLARGSKIANITSRMGSIADNDSGGSYGYRASKAALNAFGKSLAIDLKARGIAVVQLHPGFVKTRMVNFAGVLSAEESAAGLAARIEELTLETSGSFRHCNGEELPW